MTDEKCLRLLEFDKILERLSQEAQTAAGRQKCLALSPESDRVVAQEQLDQTLVTLMRWIVEHNRIDGDQIAHDLSMKETEIQSELKKLRFLTVLP